jgi:hypothetical protein
MMIRNGVAGNVYVHAYPQLYLGTVSELSRRNHDGMSLHNFSRSRAAHVSS